MGTAEKTAADLDAVPDHLAFAVFANRAIAWIAHSKLSKV